MKELLARVLRNFFTKYFLFRMDDQTGSKNDSDHVGELSI
jgi:hypothetical protein